MLTVRLGVKDLERELKFFTALGFDVQRTSGGARVELEDAVFSLEPYEELRVKDRPLLDWDQKPPQVGVGIQLYVMVPDVDEFSQRVPVGIPRPWPVQDKSWGTRELTLHTPTGYLITFAHRLLG